MENDSHLILDIFEEFSPEKKLCVGNMLSQPDQNCLKYNKVLRLDLSTSLFSMIIILKLYQQSLLNPKIKIVIQIVLIKKLI